MASSKILMGSFLAMALSVPMWADTATPKTAVPGTVNYVEGQVSIGGRPLGSTSIGSTVLEQGQSLASVQGKAELLLTPGVFLRLGDNGSVKMLSPDLTNTEVDVEQGEAIVEVDEIHPENNIRIIQNGATAQILKTGLYDFDANHSQMRVFDGQALVQVNDRRAKVKAGHEINLNVAAPKVLKFDKKTYETSDLYRWSSLRSAYVAEANVNAAPGYLAAGWSWGWGPWFGPGWIGTGWYWNPWFSCYTFIPAGGIFYSPFGWGFYSPVMVYRAPVYFGGRRYYHFTENAQAWGPGLHYDPTVRGGGFHNGFHSASGFAMRGPRGSFGGGFRSGFHGGGFHGGGFRGGFHGGMGGGHAR